MHTAKPFVQPKSNADHLLPSDAAQSVNPDRITASAGYPTVRTRPYHSIILFATRAFARADC